MSSLPENENKEQGYSIFDDPEHFGGEKKEKVSRHSMRNKIIAAVLAAALLGGGAFAAIKLIPKPAEEPKNEQIKVVNINGAVDSVKIKNELGEIEFLSKTEKTESESELKWYIAGVKEEYVSSSSISTAVDAFAGLTAIQKISAGENADYGFDNAAVTAEIKTAQESVNLTFGDTAPANIGVYCKTSTDADSVYIVSLGDALSFQVTATDYADAKGFPKVEITSKNNSCFSDDGVIMKFDYVSLGGKNYPENFKMVLQPDEAVNEYFAFKVVSPHPRIGDNDNCQVLLDLLSSGITAQGAYAFDPTEADIKKYGLDKPDVHFEASIAGEVYSADFAKVDDTYCAMLLPDKKMIQKVSIASVSFLTNTITDYYSSFIVLENLAGLKNLILENGGKKTVFDLKFTAGGDSADTYEAFFGGKELDIAKFKAYYQSIIAISPIAYDTGAKGTPEATLTFVHTENFGDTVLSFRKYSAQRYQVDINGIPLGIITKTAFDNLITATYNTAEGK